MKKAIESHVRSKEYQRYVRECEMFSIHKEINVPLSKEQLNYLNQPFNDQEVHYHIEYLTKKIHHT